MFPENMKSFIDMATMIGDLSKRVERLETLEAANIGGLCNCWCPIDYRVGPGALDFDPIPDNTPDYPSYALLYAIRHDATGITDDITLELNNDVTGYEYIYLNMDNALAGNFEVITASGQASMIVGKAPPDDIGIKYASGVIFFPYAGERNTPVIAFNACYDDQDSVGSRMRAGMYFGDNASYLAAPLTAIKLNCASFIKTGSWAALYEICQEAAEGNGG